MIGSGELDKRVRIERPVVDSSFDGAGSGSWQTVATVWAGIQDILPSRGDRLADGMNITTRPARVRMDYRADITADMRLSVIRTVAGVEVVDRVMQIVAGPAELGRREWLEFMVEEYRPAGNTA